MCFDEFVKHSLIESDYLLFKQMYLGSDMKFRSREMNFSNERLRILGEEISRLWVFWCILTYANWWGDSQAIEETARSYQKGVSSPVKDSLGS